MIKRRNNGGVKITGCGWVLGDRAGSASEWAIASEVLDRAGATDAPVADVCADLLERYPPPAAELRQDKSAWMSAVAIEQALASAGLSREAIAPERIGMVLACSLAGQMGMIEFAGEVRGQTARFVSPINFPKTVGNYPAGAIARAYDFKGPNLTVASGAAGGLDAIIEACEWIGTRQADVVLAGVTERCSEAMVGAFGGGGGVVAEGACWFVLEREGDRENVPNACRVHSWHQGAARPGEPFAPRGALAGSLALCRAMAESMRATTSAGFAEALSGIDMFTPTSVGLYSLSVQDHQEHRSELTIQWVEAANSTSIRRKES